MRKHFIISPDPDWALIKRFYDGEAAAFSEIFCKYKNLVFRLAFRFVRQREAAEDVAQDVFIKVYEKKAQPDAKSKFSTWLYRVTVNACLDVLRRKKSLPLRSLEEKSSGSEETEKDLLEILPDPKSFSPAQRVAEEELRVLVQVEIEKLPERYRIPLLLYQFQEMTYQEIAAILRITEKAVERRLYRAKERLRTRLSKYL